METGIDDTFSVFCNTKPWKFTLSLMDKKKLKTKLFQTKVASY